jgi:hypothetical protein
MGLSLMSKFGLCQACVSHIYHAVESSSLCSIHLVHVLCQIQVFESGQCLPYSILQRQLGRLKGHKLDCRLLYFLYLASPWPILRTCSWPWFCMTSACCLHNFFIMENVPWCGESCFRGASNLRGWSAAKSQAGQAWVITDLISNLWMVSLMLAFKRQLLNMS